MLRDLNDKVDSMQEQMDDIIVRGGSPNEEPRRNARDQKHQNRNENAFEGLIRRLDMVEGRISECKKNFVENAKTNKQTKEIKNIF